MAVAAQLDIVSNPAKGKGRRGSERRELKLRARGAAPSSGDTADVMVRNLSETGLLIETAAELRVGDQLEVDLPDTPRSAAKVVWAGKDLFGCAFDRPLSRSALSAAQLRSEPNTVPAESEPAGARDEGETTAEDWGRRLQNMRKAKGYTLVEFARLADVSRPTVWSWEAGKSSPRAAKKRRIEEILGPELSHTGEHMTSDVEERVNAGPSGGPESQSSAATNDLMGVIDDAKRRVASVAGISPNKVKLIIEV